MTIRGEDGQPTNKHIAFEVKDFARVWVHHPNPDVDLAVLPVGAMLKQAAAAGMLFSFSTVDAQLIPTGDELAELEAVEDIIMIGYPNGLWDSVNNSPIVRRGITATHPKLEYEGRSEFLIDAACFPGSSGSPVFLYNLGGWGHRDGSWQAGSRLKLLGVLCSGPQHTAIGQVVTVPTAERLIATSRIPNNLGVVIKASRLHDFDSILESRNTVAAV